MQGMQYEAPRTFRATKCSQCRTATVLFGVQPERPGHELLTFVCPKCQHSDTAVWKISVGPPVGRRFLSEGFRRNVRFWPLADNQSDRLTSAFGDKADITTKGISLNPSHISHIRVRLSTWGLLIKDDASAMVAHLLRSERKRASLQHLNSCMFDQRREPWRTGENSIAARTAIHGSSGASRPKSKS